MSPFISTLLHGHPAFNATFFAAASAIIPVLYLALVVQGGGIDALLKAPLNVFETVLQLIPAIAQPAVQRIASARSETLASVSAAIVLGVAAITAGTLFLVLLAATLLIVVAGGASEWSALYGLYQQRAVLRLGPNVLGPHHVAIVNLSFVVLVGATILVIATALLPFLQVLGRLFADNPSPA